MKLSSQPRYTSESNDDGSMFINSSVLGLDFGVATGISIFAERLAIQIE
jgi:hypothetical protein